MTRAVSLSLLMLALPVSQDAQTRTPAHRIAAIEGVKPEAQVADAMQSSLLDPLEAGWHGVPVCEKMHEDADHRILRCSFPPSAGHERHFHARHFGYAITGGRMRITDATGTRDVDLPTGSSFVSNGVAWHEVVNIGDSTVTYLIVEPK